MKARAGFISNSSAASFVLNTRLISPLQKAMVQHHGEAAQLIQGVLSAQHPCYMPNDCTKTIFWALGDQHPALEYYGDEWDLRETDDKIFGRTNMTNFEMEEFMDAIGIPAAAVKFNYGESYWTDEELEEWRNADKERVRK